LFLHLGCHGFWQAVEVYLIGRLRFQAGVRSNGVIELQVSADGSSCLADRGVGVQVDLLVLDGLPDALDEDVVAPAAFAVYADLDPFFFQPPVKASLVNCEPWLVLKISGFSFLERASSSASMQKEASMVIDSFQARTRRLNQSTTAAR
jgi:hypothetical protein